MMASTTAPPNTADIIILAADPLIADGLAVDFST